MNRLTTSKLTIFSCLSRVTLFIFHKKSAEFSTKLFSSLSTSGDRIFASSLVRWYVGDPMVDTIQGHRDPLWAGPRSIPTSDSQDYVVSPRPSVNSQLYTGCVLVVASSMESKLKHVKPYTMATNKACKFIYEWCINIWIPSHYSCKDTHTGPVATAAYKSQASFVAIYGIISIWILYYLYQATISIYTFCIAAAVGNQRITIILYVTA